MHIPAFRPDPPFLLGSLTGEANESQVGATSASSQIAFDKEADISLDDSESLDSGEHALDDSSEITLDSGALSLDDTSSISLDTGEVQAQVATGLAKAKAEEGITDSGEFSLDESGDDLGDFDLGEAGEEDLSLDVEEKSVEAAAGPEAADNDLDITLDLEEEKAEDSGTGEDLLRSAGPENTAPELEPLDLEAEEAPAKEEIELSLDDLKVNDTGELELGADAKPADTLDNLLEMEEIKLDEIPLTEIPPDKKQEGRVIHTAAPKKKAASKPADDDLSLDLDDLDLELEDAKPQ